MTIYSEFLNSDDEKRNFRWWQAVYPEKTLDDYRETQEWTDLRLDYEYQGPRTFEVVYRVYLTVEAPDVHKAEEQAFDTLNELVGEKYLIMFDRSEEQLIDFTSKETK